MPTQPPAFALVPPLSIRSRSTFFKSSFSHSSITSPRSSRVHPPCSTSSVIPHATAVSALDTSHVEEAWTPDSHPFRLYNTLTRDKQPFFTIEPGVVRFYSCGPTVYDFAHIGNFRAFLTYDVVKRWLIYRGYTVRHVMNLTDVDDKIIKKVSQLGGTAKQLTDKYANAFFDDLKMLNVIPADHYPRATQHIDDIEEVVTGLKKRGFAYERDGSTYFAVRNFESYGRLAQLEKRESGSLTSANAENPSDNDEYDKDDLRDFALWKSFKPEDGDVFWNNSLGKGRPGWHIECSCMAMKFLGPELDLHGGGIDLVFPHHENEIAQSEALTDRPFARFWLHNGFVNIDNEKMSKSLGNFKTMRDIVKKPDDARAFRYLVISSQYRSALAFTPQSLKSARSTVKRIDALRSRLGQVKTEGDGTDVTDVIEKATVDFRNAMDDDLNTPRAAAAMFSLVNATEKMLKSNSLGKKESQAVMTCLQDMDSVFGIFYTPELGKGGETESSDEMVITPEMAKLLEERASAKKAKNFARADEIRDQITAAGFQIFDTPQGAKLKPLDN